MVDLKCPNCSANISLDDTREYGFCSYCGTKVQIVQKVRVLHEGTVNISGIQSAEQMLSTAKKMLDVGEKGEAKKILQKIVDLYPDCGEAWLGLAYITKYHSSVIHFLNSWRGFYESSEIIKNNMINEFVDSPEMRKAQKLLAPQNISLYSELVEKYNCEIRDEILKSQKIINTYKTNFKLLVGFECTIYSESHPDITHRIREIDGEVYIDDRKIISITDNEIKLLKYKTEVEGRFFKKEKQIPLYSTLICAYANDKYLYTNLGTFVK